MRDKELPSNHETDSTSEDHNPWADMAETAPPFNPDQNPNQQETKQSKFSDNTIVEFATNWLVDSIAEKKNDLEQGNFTKWMDVTNPKQLQWSIEQDGRELEIWDEVGGMIDDTTNIPDALARLKRKYEHHGNQLVGERGQAYREKAWLIDSMKEVNGAHSYEFWIDRATEAEERAAKEAQKQEFARQHKERLEKTRQMELERPLHSPINVETLIKDSDEQLIPLAQRIDNSTFTMPGQEESADKRMEKAIQDYQRTKERRDAERTVLENMLDGSENPYYSQEDLINHLNEYRQNITPSQDKNWVQLHQACNRLINRLEKFVPDMANDLNRDDWDYWAKITSTAKPIAPESLIPRTLSKNELAKLTSDTADSTTDDGTHMENSPNGAPDSRQKEKPPVSYHFEAGLLTGEATITVGQELPDSWLESKVTKSQGGSGFGLIVKQPPLIEGYLHEALNTEFHKLSEEERSHYNYTSLSDIIEAEAKRTKRMPDIAAIIEANRNISPSQTNEPENTIEMGM